MYQAKGPDSCSGSGRKRTKHSVSHAAKCVVQPQTAAAANHSKPPARVALRTISYVGVHERNGATPTWSPGQVASHGISGQINPRTRHRSDAATGTPRILADCGFFCWAPAITFPRKPTPRQFPLSLEVATPERKKKHSHARRLQVKKPSSHVVLGRMPLTLHTTRRTPHGALRLVHAMSAWSVKTRRTPSRHRRDARAYGLKTSAVHEMSTPPPPPLTCSSNRALVKTPM